jgi:flagellar biosynthesis/type III secretory pathway protein FliH
MFSSDAPRGTRGSVVGGAPAAAAAWAPEALFAGELALPLAPDAAAAAGALHVFPEFAAHADVEELPATAAAFDLFVDPAERAARERARAAAEREAERTAAAARLAEQQRRHERAVTDAYAAGRAEGRAEGVALAQEELGAAVAACHAALEGVREGEQRWLHNLEEHVAALAVAVARHVVERELTTEPTRVKALAAAAVAEFPADQPLVLRVSPADLAMLKEAFASDVARGRELRWLPDAHVLPGGCVVEGRDRIVDGRVDTALERVYRRLSRQNA